VRLVRAVHRGRRHGAAPRPCPLPAALTRAQDSTVIVDGLTKNWRLPGWRVCWVIGPKNLISALSQSGSYLDGGANHPCVPRRACARAAHR
jgi:aspartate/methionine/tyrosine aminotransferase